MYTYVEVIINTFVPARDKIIYVQVH